mgnify:CR=1 FL=1
MYNKIDNAIKKAAGFLSNLSGALMLAIVACVTVQIVVRNLPKLIPSLKFTAPWTEEFAKYLLIWLTFLAAPVVLHRGEHLMVDLFYSKFPPKVRQFVHLFSDLFILAFCLYLLVFGVQVCMDPKIQRFRSPASGIPRVWVYAALPVGGLLLALFDLADIVKTILIILGKREDTTATGLVDESVTLAELDERKKGGRPS